MSKAVLGFLFTSLAVVAGIFWGLFDIAPHTLSLLLPITKMFFGVVAFVVIPLFVTSIVSSTSALLRSKATLTTFLRGLLWTCILVVVIAGLFFALYYLSADRFSFTNAQRDSILQLADPIDDDVTISPVYDDSKFLSPLIQLLSIVPNNIFAALAFNRVFSIIFFSLLFGAVLGFVRTRSSDFLIHLFDSFHAAFTKIFRALLYIFPLMLVVSIAHFVKHNVDMLRLVADSAQIFVVYLLIFLSFLCAITLIISIVTRRNVFSMFFTALALGLISFAGSSAIFAIPGVISFFEKGNKDEEERRNIVVARFTAPLLLGGFSIGFLVIFLSFSIFASTLAGHSLNLFHIASLMGKGSLFSMGNRGADATYFAQLFAVGGLSQEIFSRIFEIFHSLLLPFKAFISAVASFLIVATATHFSTRRKFAVVDCPESSELALEDVEIVASQDEKEVEIVLQTTQEEEAEEKIEDEIPKEEREELTTRKARLAKLLSIPLQASMIIIITGLLIIYVFLSGTIAFQGGKYSILALAEITLSELVESTTREVSLHFQSAEVSAGHAQYVLGTQSLDYTDFEEITTFFSEGVLEQNRNIIGAFIGTADGDFFMSKRMRDGSISLRRVGQEGDRILSDWTHTNKELEDDFPDSSADLEQGYDPRKRPWYRQALEAGAPSWTNVYIFSSEKILGVTYAIPLYADDGTPYGVLGFDIGLRELSEVLFAQTFLPSDRIFLFEQNTDRMVAISREMLSTLDAEEYLYRDDTSTTEFDPYRITVAESYDSILSDVYQTVRSGEGVEEIGAAPFLARILFGNSYDRSGEELHRLSRVSVQEEDYFVSFVDIPIFNDYEWSMGFIISEDELLAHVNQNNLVQILVTIVTLIIIVLIGIWFAKKLTTPLLNVALDMEKVGKLIIQDNIPVQSFIREIQGIDSALANMKRGLSSFKKYVPSDVVRQLLEVKGSAEVGGQHRELTLFFSDIENFTSKSEGRDPSVILTELSEYLDVMTAVIAKHDGTIDKYIGDSIMGFWNAPNKIEHHAERACMAAVHCQKNLATIRASNAFHRTRIGLHTGVVLVGNMGSAHRVNYTVLGDEVNLASRIEGLNKFYGTHIIISEACYKQAEERVVVRFLDQVAVKGRKNVTVIYELLGIRGEDLLFGSDLPSESVQEFLGLYWEGARYYRERDWAKAASCFARAYKIIPTDRPVKLLYARSYHFYRNPPPDDWNGTVRLDSR